MNQETSLPAINDVLQICDSLLRESGFVEIAHAQPGIEHGVVRLHG
jgi:hypothetical protein